MDLVYRSFVNVEALTLNECTIHAASEAPDKRWWQLWFFVARETDGQAEAFVVPVAPGGLYNEHGPGDRRTWGFTDVGGGAWQIDPSIDVVQDADATLIHPGPHPTLPSLWHQTPRVVGVPTNERWQLSEPENGRT
jgi:hypothetical protein